MTYSLITNGNRIAGCRVLNEETGQDITAQLGARSICLRIEPGKKPKLELEVNLHCKVAELGRPEWYARNPRTGGAGKLSKLIFDDGSVVDLSESAEQLFGPKNPGAGELE